MMKGGGDGEREIERESERVAWGEGERGRMVIRLSVGLEGRKDTKKYNHSNEHYKQIQSEVGQAGGKGSMGLQQGR
jgi:hypothetical protein